MPIEKVVKDTETGTSQGNGNWGGASGPTANDSTDHSLMRMR